MKLIVILLCLAIERYAGISSALRRNDAIQAYLGHMHALVEKTKLPSAYLQLAAYVLPAIFAFAIICWLTCSVAIGLFGVVLHGALLLYCLGPDNLYEHNDSDISDDVFVSANQRYFTVIFLYVMPFGFLLIMTYRLVAMLCSMKDDIRFTAVTAPAQLLRDILEWVPARISGLCYAVVGNFMPTFTYWLSHLFGNLDSSRSLLRETGALAYASVKTEKESTEGDDNLIAVIDRVMVVFCVIIAIFTLGAVVS